nr:immunoglobulin heavy chain junction region [Mus musculus]
LFKGGMVTTRYGLL